MAAMSQVCIVTDSTVQFAKSHFPGRELVTILPLMVQFNGKVFSAEHLITLLDLPQSLPLRSQPLVQPPSRQKIEQVLHNLAQKYHEIVLILPSRHLHPTFDFAMQVLETIRPSAAVHIIDSQTTSIGLGELVQIAAKAAQENVPAIEIKRHVLGLIPRVYVLFCFRSLTYLQNTGQLEVSQAVVGELLGISPLYTLDSGKPIPLYKARSARNLVDIFHEFITEINDLRQLVLLQGYPPFLPEVRSLRERVQADFPEATCVEMSLSPVLGAMLGPHTLGAIGISGLE
ncbi:MAG: DegV family EDD domain-containing protein [Anaerolineales bacterium]|nr:MAG: DegV family EDD domain-containing protein [Anaerolineales bacterium]